MKDGLAGVTERYAPAGYTFYFLVLRSCERTCRRINVSVLVWALLDICGMDEVQEEKVVEHACLVLLGGASPVSYVYWRNSWSRRYWILTGRK